MTTLFVFGESQNDTKALVELIYARADHDKKTAHAIALRKPLIQQKGTRPRTKKSNAQKIADVVKARMRVSRERSVTVVAHQDCDDVEPSHTDVAGQIEAGLNQMGVTVIAAAPAFEMEAWWYLWPDAVADVCKTWRRLGRKGTKVGLIQNVKEVLRRELRPLSKKTTREYSEVDGPSIARKVRELKLIDQQNAVANSFAEFDAKLKKALG